jgi:hypothetical protein
MNAAIGYFQHLNAEILNIEMESPYSKTFNGSLWVYTAQGTNSTNITIQSDEKIVVRQHHVRHGYTFNNASSETTFQVRYGNSSNTVTIYRNYTGTGTQTNTSGILGQTIFGPCVITIDARHTGNTLSTSYANYEYSLISLFSLEKEKVQEPGSMGSSANSVPIAAVVVPSSAVGDVDVLLEQSNDMITWTQCLPGTYNAATQKRFFRVRAVEK